MRGQCARSGPRRCAAAGGEGWKDALETAELYELRTDRWSEPFRLPSGHYDYTATLLPDGRVLLIGGRGRGGWTAAVVIVGPP